MQVDPRYDDVVATWRPFSRSGSRSPSRPGIPEERICLDPGIGFGKTPDQSLELVRGLDRIAALGRPVLVGLSRKSTLGRVLGDPAARTGTAAAPSARRWPRSIAGRRCSASMTCAPHVEALAGGGSGGAGDGRDDHRAGRDRAARAPRGAGARAPRRSAVSRRRGARPGGRGGGPQRRHRGRRRLPSRRRACPRRLGRARLQPARGASPRRSPMRCSPTSRSMLFASACGSPTSSSSRRSSLRPSASSAGSSRAEIRRVVLDETRMRVDGVADAFRERHGQVGEPPAPVFVT